MGDEAALQALARVEWADPQHLANGVAHLTARLLHPRALHTLDWTGSWGSDGSGEVCLLGLRTCLLPYVPTPSLLLLPSFAGERLGGVCAGPGVGVLVRPR